MKKKYIIALDQGTTSSRSVVVDENGKIVKIVQQEINQIFPKPSWVEHDPIEILNTQLYTLKKVISLAKIKTFEIIGIGITNQRETTVVWNKNTGKPIYNAIVCQDKRTSNVCKNLKYRGLGNYIKKLQDLLLIVIFQLQKLIGF